MPEPTHTFGPFKLTNAGIAHDFPDGAGGFIHVPTGVSHHVSLPVPVLNVIRRSYLTTHNLTELGMANIPHSGSGLMRLERVEEDGR